MNINTTEITKDEGQVGTIQFSCELKQLREIVQEVADNIVELPGLEQANTVRKKKTNPVIKTDGPDKLYFRWEKGEGRLNLTLANDEISDVATVTIMEMDESKPYGMLPFRATDMHPIALKHQESDTGMGEMMERQEEIDEALEEMGADNSMDEAWNAPGEGREGEYADATFEDVGEGPTDYSDAEFEDVEPIELDSEEDRSGSRRPSIEGEKRQPVDGEETSIIPPYTKPGASYHPPAEGPKPHLDCKDCVHYVQGGGCKMVQGEVDPDGYCEDLFADFGLFGTMDNTEFKVNLAVWGEMFEDRFQNVSITEMADEIKETIGNKL